METRAVIGTAGHVDHGKTTLVRELTGIDTDRLAEEKARGISIELGFAWLPLGDGRAAMVDVPGHERFVRQMIAGAAGVDLVLLVIAADEGVMPQTREHLDICQLLGVRSGAIVLTKCDLVDEAWLELVIEDVAAAVAGTFLEGAPVVTFAAGDAAARARVEATIAERVDDAVKRGLLAHRSSDRAFKLSVDRAFTLRGFGTVVTGTTVAGILAVGDTVEVLPSGTATRIRGIEVHGDAVRSVGAGVRAALNLQGVDHGEVHRGDVVATPGALVTTSMIDGTLTALRRLESPIRDGAKGLVHIGTTQVEATLALLGVSELGPGESCAVQLRLAEPRAFLPGERYIVRGFEVLAGYGKTIGGGRALIAQEHRHRRQSAAPRALIELLAEGAPGPAIRAYVAAAGEGGVSAQALADALPFARELVRAAIAELSLAGELVVGGARVYADSVLAQLSERVFVLLRGYHTEHPARLGLGEDELRTRLRASLPVDVMALVVARGLASGRFAREGELLRLGSFIPRRSPAQDAATERVRAAIVGAGLSPPRIQDLPELLRLAPALVDEAISFIVEDGVAVRVNRELVFERGALSALEERMRAHFAQSDLLDTATFKDLTGVSRKWTIPLSEHFDRVKLTVRHGDLRRLRGDAKKG